MLSDTNIITNAYLISATILITSQSTNGNIQSRANLGALSFGVGASLVSTERKLTMIAGQGNVIEAAGDMNFTAATGLLVSNPLTINGDAGFDVAAFDVQQDSTTTDGGNNTFNQGSVMTSAGKPTLPALSASNDVTFIAVTNLTLQAVTMDSGDL